jgi:cyclopropane-fatty-acyl-phospholipid synthase
MDDRAAAPAAPLPVSRDTIADVTRDLPVAARKALALAAGLAWGSLTIALPDGRVLEVRGREPGLSAAMAIRDWGFASRLARAGDLGLAEGYLRGEWDSPDLAAFIELFARNRRLSETLLPEKPLVRLWQLFRHFLNRNTRTGARRNIHAHYDLGNRFYEAWLDRTMTYSSAIFAPGDNDLASAQTRKYRALADALDLKPSHHVLEIGCGWGGFAAFAAEEIGCRVTGLTISKEQFAYANARIAQAGLADRVAFKLQDYRDETGTYDRIAAIEMFEAVGEAYWPAFFRQMRDRLAAGGRAGSRSSPSARRASRTTGARSTSSAATSSRAACCRAPRSCANWAALRGAARGERAFGPITPAPSRCGASASARLAPPRAARLRRALPALWEYYLAYWRGGLPLREHRRPADDLRQGLRAGPIP